MATVELEIWGNNRDTDYARLFTELDEEEATKLYEQLYSTADEWCDSRNLAPKKYRRTTGKDVHLSDVLQWYTEEGLLTRIEVDAGTAFLPVPSVQDELSQPSTQKALIRIND